MCRSAKTRSSISNCRATSRRNSTTISPTRSASSGFGDVFFPQPEPMIQGPATRVMSLRDGTKKMSKSDASDYSRINLTDDADAIAQKIRKAKTDPRSAAERREGAGSAAGGRQSGRHLRGAGGQHQSRGAARNLAARNSRPSRRRWSILLVAKLSPIGGEMKRLAGDPGYIDGVLGDGADRARAIAAETMNAVKDIVGFVRLSRKAEPGACRCRSACAMPPFARP